MVVYPCLLTTLTIQIHKLTGHQANEAINKWQDSLGGLGSPGTNNKYEREREMLPQFIWKPESFQPITIMLLWSSFRIPFVASFLYLHLLMAVKITTEIEKRKRRMTNLKIWRSLLSSLKEPCRHSSEVVKNISLFSSDIPLTSFASTDIQLFRVSPNSRFQPSTISCIRHLLYSNSQGSSIKHHQCSSEGVHFILSINLGQIALERPFEWNSSRGDCHLGFTRARGSILKTFRLVSSRP